MTGMYVDDWHIKCVSDISLNLVNNLTHHQALSLVLACNNLQMFFFPVFDLAILL